MTNTRLVSSVSVDGIDDREHARRPIKAENLKSIADSMRAIGLLTPITVRRRSNGVTTLVAGGHRLAAAKQLGWKSIEAFCLPEGTDERDAELAAIAENLHRADLSALERDQQVARWVDLVNRKPVQVEQVSVGGRGNKGGEAQASRDLGLSRPDVHRAIQVANIDPEAKTAAKAAGLDDNRTALLKVAKEPTAARQVEAVRSLAQQKMDSSIAAKTRQRATREVASIITKYVPPEFLPAVRANLAVCGPPSAIVKEIEILEAKAK